MKDLKIKYVDLGNSLVITTNKKGLEEIEQNFTQLSGRLADIKLTQADYQNPELINNLRFSSRKNRIEITTENGNGWDFEVNPDTWYELKEKASKLHNNQERRVMLFEDQEAIPSYRMYLELEDEEELALV